MPRLLDGQVTIVTGAGSGIGLASARLFAAEGARLVLADINRETVRSAVDQIVADGGEAVSLRCDVSQENDVAAMVRLAIDTWGRLDCAFNNAGVGAVETPLTDDTVEQWQRIIGIDLFGTMLCLKHQIPAMLDSGGGAIVNNASNAGKAAVPTLGSYAAAKAGVINLTMTAAVEFGDRGIRVNAVCPGLIMTETIRELIADGAEMAKTLQIPAGRPGEPQEVAELAAWLLSRRASYVTGQAISADGGQNACQ